jgi:long-subunit acyl-CoA synthetase (AMP-forming)
LIPFSPTPISPRTWRSASRRRGGRSTGPWPVETVKKFRILDKQLDPEDGDVTPTMKVKRRAISQRYGELIEEMYRD